MGKQYTMDEVVEEVFKEDDVEREKIKPEELIGEVFVVEGVFPRVNPETNSEYMSFHIDKDGKKYFMNTVSKVLMGQGKQFLDFPINFPDETIKVKLEQRLSKKNKLHYYIFINED